MDHVARPRTLEQNARAYAAYVHDDTMAPRYHVGECLYVAPGLPARPGTYVMVHRLNGRAQLRRLTAISADTVVLTTHNPQHDETVARAEITSIDPIVLAGQAAPA
jgi:phage repressor protein C with HTH and peptisase S24 domain